MSPLALFFLLVALVFSAHGNDPCSQPIVAGHCKAYFPSWGYKSEEKACVHFVYGGCQGNDNRFNTKEECEAKCLGK